MDEKAIRTTLYDFLSSLRERLSYTRVRNLSMDECARIEKAAIYLWKELPIPPDIQLEEGEDALVRNERKKTIALSTEVLATSVSDDTLKRVLEERRKALKVKDEG